MTESEVQREEHRARLLEQGHLARPYPSQLHDDIAICPQCWWLGDGPWEVEFLIESDEWWCSHCGWSCYVD